MNRRDLLKGSLATGAALVGSTALPVLPTKVAAQALPAQPRTGTPLERTLFDVAKRELDRAGGAIWRRDIVGICDYGVHSARQRFYLVNMDLEEVTAFHVSHGSGSDRNHDGLDPSNEAALRRYIVMHRATYAEPTHLEKWGKMGRSQGCFVFGTDDFRNVLLNLSGGRLLYADSLGIQEDGAMLSREQQLALADPEMQILTPDNPTATQRWVPGTF